MTAAVGTRPPLRWHLPSREILPLYFGYHEKKPLTYDVLSIHRQNLRLLDDEFGFARSQPDVPTRAEDEHESVEADNSMLMNNTQSITDREIEGSLSSTQQPYKYNTRQQQQEEKQQEEEQKQLSKEKDNKPEQVLADETRDYMAEGVEGGTTTEVYAATTGDAELHDKTQDVASSGKALGVVNTTYETRPQSPVSTAKVDSQSFFPTYQPDAEVARHTAGTSMTYAGESAGVSGVAIPVAVAEPVDSELRESVHADATKQQDERLEEERAAAIAAGSAMAITVALADQHAADQQNKAEHTDIVLPVAAETTGREATEPQLQDQDQRESSLLSVGTPSLTGASGGTPVASPQIDPTSGSVSTTSMERLKLQQEEDAYKASEASKSKSKSRVQKLADLHEHIIRQDKLAALGPDVEQVKESPTLAPEKPASKIQQLHELHLAQQAESGVTHTYVEKIEKQKQQKTAQKGGGSGSTSPRAPSNTPTGSTTPTGSKASTPKGGKIAEMKRLHEEKIKEEIEAKNKTEQNKKNISQAAKQKRGGKK